MLVDEPGQSLAPELWSSTSSSLWSHTHSSCKNKFEKAKIDAKQKAPETDYSEAINMQNSNPQSPSEEGVGMSLSQEHQKLEVRTPPPSKGLRKSQLQSPQKQPIIRATKWRGWMNNEEMNLREATSFP